jgi:hypothetical protein
MRFVRRKPDNRSSAPQGASERSNDGTLRLPVKAVAALVCLGALGLVVGLIVELSGRSESAAVRVVSLQHGAVRPSGEAATERTYAVHLDCGDSNRTRALNRSFGHGIRCLRFNVVVWDAHVGGGQLTLGRRAGTDQGSFVQVVPRRGMSVGGDGLVHSLDVVDSTAVADSFVGWNSPSDTHASLTRARRGTAGGEFGFSTGYLHGEKVYVVRSQVSYPNHCCFLPGMRPRPHPAYLAYFDPKSYVLVALKGQGWGMMVRREIVEPLSRVPQIAFGG